MAPDQRCSLALYRAFRFCGAFGQIVAMAFNREEIVPPPFGVTLEWTERHPWEAMARHTANFSMQEMFFGFTYLAVGEVTNRARQVVAESHRGILAKHLP